MKIDIEKYMQIFRRDIETFFELMKAESKVLLENICKETENRARNFLEETEEKKTLTISQTLHDNNEIRRRGSYGAGGLRETEGNFDDLTLSGTENSCGKEAYDIQTQHDDEIRVRGNDGAGGDGNEIVKVAENCIRKMILFETTDEYLIFVLGKGGGKTVV